MLQPAARIMRTVSATRCGEVAVDAGAEVEVFEEDRDGDDDIADCFSVYEFVFFGCVAFLLLVLLWCIAGKFSVYTNSRSTAKRPPCCF